MILKRYSMLGLALWAGSLFAFWEPESAAILTGTVTWKGHPVRAARVALPTLRLHTPTDSLGRYSLEIPTSILSASEAMVVSGSINPQGRLFRPDGRIIPWPGESVFFNRHQLLFKDPGRPGRDQGGLVAPEPGMGRKVTASGPELLTVSARGYLDGPIPITSGQTKADAVLERDQRKHLWIWQTKVVTDPSERKALLDFGKTKDIGTYYLFVGGVMATQPTAIAAKAVRALAESQEKFWRTPPVTLQFDVEPYALDEYALAKGKEVVIGVETIAGFEPPSVTFAEEGEKAMDAVLEAVMMRYAPDAAFCGTAVHQYQSYLTLKP